MLILPLCSIYSNSGHVGWSAGISNTILKLDTKDDCGQVWFQLAQWFLRRRFLKKFTPTTEDDDDDDDTDDDDADDGRQVMAKAHMAF